MLTLKIQIKTSVETGLKITDLQRQQTSLIKYSYNRFKEGLSSTAVNKKAKNLSNQSLHCWFRVSAYSFATYILDKERETKTEHRTVCFRKDLLKLRSKNKISKEEYKERKLLNLISTGEANQKGNRFFRINSKANQVIFRPGGKHLYQVQLPKLSKTYQRYLLELETKMNLKEIPVTFQLNKDFIYITFDEVKLLGKKYFKIKENRVLAIDLNPNYIGYSIVDWLNEEYKIVDKGLISTKKLNDLESSLKEKSNSVKRKYLTNKRRYEVFQINKFLVEKARHFECESFVVEDLDIKNKDHGKGRKLNRLINNQWSRAKLIENLKKRINLTNIRFIQVLPQYSSFVGNIKYRKENLPDPVLASIELSRRGYEFNLQYFKKVKSKKQNIVFPEMDSYSLETLQSLVPKSLEVSSTGLRERGKSENLNDNNLWKDYYLQFKNSKTTYRVPLESFERNYKVLDLFSKPSLLRLYNFNNIRFI